MADARGGDARAGNKEPPPAREAVAPTGETSPPAEDGARPLRSRLGLLVGPALAAALLLAPAPAGLEPAAWRTAAVAALMAVWWLTEAIPIPATALLPLALLPLLGAGSVTEAAAPYANPVIFLFLGGFLLALGMQRWGLHRRIALEILSRSGSSPRALVGGFMVATAFLSLWVSNTATAMMMLPIGISVIGLLEGGKGRSRQEPGGLPADPGASAEPGTLMEPGRSSADPEASPGRGFATALMLGIAYAASIGGLGTLIGTPPNAFLAGFAAQAYGIELGFARWMIVGVPVSAIGLGLAWLLLTRVAFRLGSRPFAAGRELVREELAALGPPSPPERRVAVACAATAALWIGRPLLEPHVPGLSDAGIAVAAGVSLFALPAGAEGGARLLNWEWAEKLPWDILVLFGGGLSLAAAIERTGLNEWIGQSAGGALGWGPVALTLLVATAIVFLTELTSNTATAAAFLPIVGAVAVRAGWDPLMLAVPAALAASCAFMLPVATPPNAIVYGSHRVTVPEMARAGWWLNLAMILLVTAAALVLVPMAFGATAGP